MFRRDYMLKMIEEFARVLGHVIGLKDNGKQHEGLAELRKAYKTWFDLEADTFSAMSSEEFLQLLITQKEFAFQQLEVLSKALITEADLIDEHSLIERRDRYSKALTLLEYLEKHDTTTFSMERKMKVSELRTILID